MTFDEAAYKLHLAQERKKRGLPAKLDLAVFKFDPGKHRRGFKGRFIDMPDAPDLPSTGDESGDIKADLTDAVGRLKPGESVELPDKTRITKLSNGNHSISGGGKPDATAGSDVDAAVDSVLARSSFGVTGSDGMTINGSSAGSTLSKYEDEAAYGFRYEDRAKILMAEAETKDDYSNMLDGFVTTLPSSAKDDRDKIKQELLDEYDPKLYQDRVEKQHRERIQEFASLAEDDPDPGESFDNYMDGYTSHYGPGSADPDLVEKLSKELRPGSSDTGGTSVDDVFGRFDELGIDEVDGDADSFVNGSQNGGKDHIVATRDPNSGDWTIEHSREESDDQSEWDGVGESVKEFSGPNALEDFSKYWSETNGSENGPFSGSEGTTRVDVKWGDKNNASLNEVADHLTETGWNVKKDGTTLHLKGNIRNQEAKVSVDPDTGELTVTYKDDQGENTWKGPEALSELQMEAIK